VSGGELEDCYKVAKLKYVVKKKIHKTLFKEKAVMITTIFKSF
jgi:hypothetical protein